MPHAAAVAADLFEVLIVDDERDSRELLADFCRTLGFTVATAQDGRAAIAAVQRAPNQFGVVLTDLNMPGADGFDVLRAARAANPTCYVVMITGYATLDSAVRAVKEGAYDFLAKPFAFGQLELVLTRVRDRMALEQENRDLNQQVLQSRPDRTPTRDYAWRLESIEQRLADIEVLLRAVIDGRQ